MEADLWVIETRLAVSGDLRILGIRKVKRFYPEGTWMDIRIREVMEEAEEEEEEAEEEGERKNRSWGVEPVRLTPSWESTNVPSEELNFKGLNTFENFEMGVDPPKDRYRLVFLTLVLHGVGTLMPWNMFITAKNYFVEYKLATADEDLNTYATNFLPYIGYASQIPNVIFNWLNIFIQMGGNLTTRIVWSILVEVVVFVVTVVLAMVDSSDWPGVFFWITIASVVILNVANGIYQNTVYGMAARLPFSYTGAVVLGSNISGTFTAIINIMAIAMAPNTRTSAIYYFITALFVLLACFDTYFALPLNRFFRYHEAMHDRAKKSSKNDRRKPRTPYWHIFKSAFPQLFNVFMVFFVTLAVFPAVLADTCRTEENFPITPKYYQAVTCFLTFNMFAMLGNMLPALFTWPSPRFLCVPVLLRLFLIPAFVLCHFYPVKAVRIMPVLIDSDWAYWALSVVLGVTSGYYSSLAMMYCPRTVEPEHAPVAGMMGAASLITGIFSGIVFQIVCTYAVTNISFEIPGYEFPFRNCTNRMT
ncbi:equilibrative nucleoside transporter 1-like isoform X2 [Scylla paramamosain]|uniref:equilibrative nucleoside transporter 1-like isoform X2 n=1 Tax=Scylla paramamosain TaxID=85552 RepID=UPI003083B6E1